MLDLGFNMIQVLPIHAFHGISELTLLALDGNPMATLPEDAFRHLNGSLRGLSLGGKFLTCDCHMKWVPNWINNFDLQVTSRERNPQFCGNPQELRDRSFYQLSEDGKRYSAFAQMSHPNSEEQLTIETLKGAITIIVEHKSHFMFCFTPGVTRPGVWADVTHCYMSHTIDTN